MSDMRDFLGRGIEGFNPSPEEGLERTRDRTRKRHRRRQFLAGAVTVAMFGGTLAGAVWLGDQRGRPIAGPTPSPSGSFDQVVTGNQVWLCRPRLHREGHVCFARIGPVVDVTDGEESGEPWSLRAFQAMYWGPPLGSGEGPSVRVPVLCTVWRGGDAAPSAACHRTLGEDRLVAVGPPPSLADAPLARLLEPGDQGPLWGIEDTGGGYSFERMGSDSVAVWAWTPQQTARVEMTVEDISVGSSKLVGPFDALRTDLKWFVAFLPPEPHLVTYAGYDDAGRVLWEGLGEMPGPRGPGSPMVPTSPQVVVGRGTYGVREWTLRAQLITVDGRAGICFRLNYVGYTDNIGGGCTLPLHLTESAGLFGWGGNLEFPLALYGHAPLETASVEVEHAGKITEGFLFRAPPELGGDFQFVVGFAPSLDVTVTTTGYDAEGNEIWKDVKKATPEDE
jgi:hypothetical protein